MALRNSNTAADPGNVQVRQNSYASQHGIKPQYQVVLSVTGDDKGVTEGKGVFPIVASLPERYNIALSSSWDTPFSSKSIGEMLFGSGAKAAATDTVAQTLGIGTRLKPQTIQVWQSTSGLSFNLDLMFNAITNTKKDVMNKHIALLKLVCPSEWHGMLFAPGPNFTKDLLKLEGRHISLQLGQYMKLDNIIIKDVSSDVQTICGEDGIPHFMSINIAVETYHQCVTSQDIDKIFIAG